MNPRTRNQPTMLIIDGKPFSHEKTIFEDFCKYVTNIVSYLKHKVFPLTNFTWRYRQTLTAYSNNHWDQDPKPSKELKCKMCCNIPPCFLENVTYVMAKLLTHVINISLKERNSARNSFDNYRPILQVIFKVIKKCVHTQIMAHHLKSNNLISSYQFRFWKKQLTELWTAYFMDHIRKAMNTGQLTDTICRPSKMFDTISHVTIVDKLPHYGITDIAQ